MTGRPGLGLGEHGSVTTTLLKSGKVSARVKVRDHDGRRREVSAVGDTKGAAKRELQRRLDARVEPTSAGLRPDMTFEAAAAYWLERRRLGGRNSPPIKPQTLGAYEGELRRLIVPGIGEIKLFELRIAGLETFLSDLDQTGISTAQARTVLKQVLAMAFRHEAIASNPMDRVLPPVREPSEVDVLNVTQVKRLRHAVLPTTLHIPKARRGPNDDLHELIDFELGTGCRIGESLAINWKHLALDGALPTVYICGTLVEPRKGYIDKLYRQESPKTKDSERTLILPKHLVELLRERRERSPHSADNDPVFSSLTGSYLWPSNLRTRLRKAILNDPELAGTTPHTLRRSVATLIAHERSLDAARDQLGHAAPGITGHRYVANRVVGPDVREVLDRFFQ